VRDLVRGMGLPAVVVTHDNALGRLLAHRLVAMKDGREVETGLGGAVFEGTQDADLSVASGDCAVVTGTLGMGKVTLAATGTIRGGVGRFTELAA
jgi:ABC-type lipoprotein export system ATPase subunit